VSERLFARLAARLADGHAVVVACVLDTQGAVPRRRGATMLVARDGIEGSIGGGEAEARVLAAARAMLEGDTRATSLAIDLTGRPGAAGICGGHMAIALRCWRGDADSARAKEILDALSGGVATPLDAGDLGAPGTLRVEPAPRLLVVGAGHCGEALARLARELEFDVWVHDARAECFAPDRFDGATILCGGPTLLARALDTARPVYAVLLNRDFAADVAALEVIAPARPAFLGMMGSRRRVAQVRQSLPDSERELATLAAPIGLDIGAETPEEIAVSILAQLVQARRKPTPA
jgi:xanthine dehydrogenase accessory factor